jgi:radical SAM superfamily enzyme YgiQ (UPF0313 family)
MPDTFWSMKYATKVFGKKAMYPPLGLITVANLLPKEWNKQLIDLNVTSLLDEKILWADFVFISAMNVQEESAKETISVCKELNKKIVAGGTLFTHEYGKFNDVDHFVLNEAEITLPLFLQDLENGNLKRIYQTDQFASVEESPLPDWSLVDVKKYHYAIIQYSRGCPYNCDFCDVTSLFGRKPRTKTSAQIINELKEISKYENFPFILFADDNLIGNRKILMSDLLPALIKWRQENKPSVYFATQVTINLADDEKLMRLMLEAGFRHIFIGIETPDEASLLESRKTQNLKRDMLDSIKKLNENGFIVVGGFIVGFDSDDENIFQRQIKFIQESGIVLATVNVLKAPPGTELYQRMKKENRLIEGFSFHEGETNFIPKMNLSVLQEGFNKLISTVYSPSAIFRRNQKFISNYKFPKVENKIPNPPVSVYLIPFLRSIYLIGLKSNVRFYYWKTIIWTLLNKKKFIDHGVFNAVMIFQLQKLYDKYNFTQKFNSV